MEFDLEYWKAGEFHYFRDKLTGVFISDKDVQIALKHCLEDLDCWYGICSSDCKHFTSCDRKGIPVDDL